MLFDDTSLFFKFGTALLAISLLISNSYLKDVDPGQLAQKHREVASDIWNVREGYLSLLTDTRDPSFAIADLRARLLSCRHSFIKFTALRCDWRWRLPNEETVYIEAKMMRLVLRYHPC